MTSEMSLGEPPNPPFTGPWKSHFQKSAKTRGFRPGFPEIGRFTRVQCKAFHAADPWFFRGQFWAFFWVMFWCYCFWGFLESEWAWKRSKLGPRRPQAPPRPPMTPPNRGQDRFWTPKRASKSMKNRLKNEPWKKGLFRSPLPRKCKMFWLWNWKGRC